MRRLLSEPLLHFLLLGAGVFLVYSMLQTRSPRGERGEIVITQGQIEHLATGFTKTWQRPPGAQELRGLIQDRLREEVYYREAMAMGLDVDDAIIRRRLRQKLEFLSDDIVALAEPTDEELDAYLQAHPDAFRVEPRFTFRQVCLDPQKHADDLSRDVAQLLRQLNAAGGEQVDPAGCGDSLLLEHEFVSTSPSEAARQFGGTFAEALSELVPGPWQGPFESGYGVHLVSVSERSEGRLPALDEVRDAVRREWESAQRQAANEQFFQRLLERYSVIIEGLEPGPEQQGLAVSTAR